VLSLYRSFRDLTAVLSCYGQFLANDTNVDLGGLGHKRNANHVISTIYEISSARFHASSSSRSTGHSVAMGTSLVVNPTLCRALSTILLLSLAGRIKVMSINFDDTVRKSSS
jgi:hypothetical protein